MVFAALQVPGRPGDPGGWVRARPRAGSSKGNPASRAAQLRALLGEWAAGSAVLGHVSPPVSYQQAVSERGGGRTGGHRCRAGRPGCSAEQPGSEAGGVGAHGRAGEQGLWAGAGVRAERRGWAPPLTPLLPRTASPPSQNSRTISGSSGESGPSLGSPAGAGPSAERGWEGGRGPVLNLVPHPQAPETDSEGVPPALGGVQGDHPVLLQEPGRGPRGAHPAAQPQG